MLRSNEIILPLILAIILTVIPLWMLFNYTGKFFYFQTISKSGIKKGALLLDKHIKINDNKLFNLFLFDNSENYRFKIGFRSLDEQWIECELGVTKDTYYAIGIRDELLIIYPPNNPISCTLPDAIEITRYLILATLIVAIIILLLALGFFYYIYTSYRKPEPGDFVQPTTNLDLGSKITNCPKCSKEMDEGYMPTVGGVSWRDKDEPIGIPTIFNGLRGTTFWVKRPLLHAFHCKKCGIITFKYDNNN